MILLWRLMISSNSTPDTSRGGRGEQRESRPRSQSTSTEADLADYQDSHSRSRLSSCPCSSSPGCVSLSAVIASVPCLPQHSASSMSMVLHPSEALKKAETSSQREVSGNYIPP